jgi:pilus assembly protein CpaC
VLGSLFKSKSFQKNETELMFIVTAQLVKPVNRDDLPQMRGIDGLKNGSPLGLEPKGEGIEGQTGYKVSGQNTSTTTTTDATTTASTVEAPKTSSRVVNQPLPPPTVTSRMLSEMTKTKLE